MDNRKKSLINIHVSVVLFGLSGLFGKFLSLPPMIIVLGRVLFSSVFLLGIIFLLRKNIKLKSIRHFVYMIILGAILAIHWSAFYTSIQVSTVAIGLLTISTFPVFVTFLEPFIFKERISKSNVYIALITLAGVICVIPKYDFGYGQSQGVIWGILSSFSYAILSMLNRKYVREYSSVVIAFYEQSVAAVLLLPFLFLRPEYSMKDVVLLLLLGIVFTAFAHSLFIRGLKYIKTQTAGIISSLEPVYGIIFAVLLLKEIPNIKEIIGGVIILGTTFYSTIRSK